MTDKLHILNLEDSPNDAELIREKLTEEGVDCEIRRVDDRADFIEALDRGDIDLILADYTMPGFDGMSALAIALKKCPDIPFIFVSGTIGEDVAIEALKNGATDYVIKSTLFRLAPAVRRALNETKERVTRKLAEVELKESEDRYRSLFNKSTDAIILATPDGRIHAANSAACRIFGLTEEEFRRLGRAGIVDSSNQRLLAALEQRDRTGNFSGEITFVRKDGTRFPGDISSTIYTDSQGVPKASIIIRDITERRRVEEELGRLNRILQARSRSSKAMMHTKDEQEYLNEVCRIIIEDCGHALVWIGYAEDNEAKTVRPVAHAGFEDGYLESAKITWADNERGRGPVGTAIRTGKPSLFRNILTDSTFAPWREEALKRGYASVIGIPLLKDGKAYGSLNIYSREQDPFSDDEVRLLSDLAADLSYGIAAIRLRTTHDEAETALRKSESRFRALFENMLEGFAYCRMLFENDVPLDFIYLEVNSAFEKLTGLKDVVGKKVSEAIPGIREALPELLAIYGRVALTGKPERFETFSESFGGWLSISVYSTEQEYFVAVFDNITERKQAEKKLETSYSLLKATFDSTSGGLLVVDDQSRMIQYNQKFLELWRVPAEVMESKDEQKALSLVLDQLQNPEKFIAKIKELYEHPEADSFDVLEFKDGRIFERYSQPQKIGGKSIGRVWNFIDVTERKRAEVELVKNRRFLVDLLENSGALIFVKDLEGRYTLVNRKWEEMINLRRKDVLGKTDEMLFPGPIGKQFRLNDLEAMESGTAIEKEEVLEDDQGRRFFISIKFPLLDDKGVVSGMCGMATEITHRRLAEESLRASETKFRKLSQEFHGLLDAIPDSLMLLDKDLKVEWANKSVALSAGKARDGIEGQYCHGLWYGLSAPCDPCPVLQSFETGKPINQIVTRQDGKVWDLRTIPLVNEQGEVVNVIELIREITDYRKLEEQLRHAQKMEAIGTLAGGVAHDFNNILNVIMGYGGLVLDKMGPDDPSREEMNEVLAAADRAAILTRRLLVFSRKQVMEVKPVDVNDIITGVQKMLSRVIGEDIDLQVDLADKRLTVMADAGQIEQVLMNLATNARDAMPKGGRLEITTETGQMDDAYVAAYGYGRTGAYAVIAVADTGKGMDEETQKKIFEPFFTTKGIGEGTGLGLAVSYGIMKQHNGYIKCYSETGKGTVFKIYLPLIEETAAVGIKAEVPVSVKGGTETILVAEDDPTLRKLAKVVLESVGYGVILAEDGEIAVTKFIENRDRIKLVILDLVMPRKSGKEAYEEIKKMSPGIRTFFLSGYTMDMISRMEIEEGMEVLRKPVAPNDLLRKVREVLDK